MTLLFALKDKFVKSDTAVALAKVTLALASERVRLSDSSRDSSPKPFSANANAVVPGENSGRENTMVPDVGTI